ncbi:MAG: SDR family oxidoreductase [Bacteroidetes bacterium]|nr:SDR family oxidoreductase [Bacteroidota bacterium]
MLKKVAIITGASSGIGKACALAFSNKGYNVALAARNQNKLNDVVIECETIGAKAIAVSTDVSQEEDCKRLIEKTIAEFGRIDVLVNNAGISMRAVFNDLDLDVLRQVMDINFWGMVYCTKYALPHILAQKGSVVGVSSIAGYRGLPARTGYSASKFAMNGFLEALRTENFKTGLHVLTICPGFTASNIRNAALTADGSSQGESPREEIKMMQPEEVADIMIRGIENRKKIITLTTQGKLTVFLNKWFPSFMDKMVYNTIKKEPDSPFK